MVNSEKSRLVRQFSSAGKVDSVDYRKAAQKDSPRVDAQKLGASRRVVQNGKVLLSFVFRNFSTKKPSFIFENVIANFMSE